MKTVKIFKNASGTISVSISYPHWSSGKKVKQTYTFFNDEKGIKDSEKSVKRFVAKGYKLIK